MCKEGKKPTTGERVGLALETGRLGSQQQQATDDVTGLEGLWGPFPDIWCSFGRGMKWLWRSRRIDRQSLFCAYFLQRSAIVSLTHSRTHALPPAHPLTHATAAGAAALVLMLVLMLAGWWAIRRPPFHPSIHPTTRYATIFFFLQRLGGPDGQVITAYRTWVARYVS